MVYSSLLDEEDSWRLTQCLSLLEGDGTDMGTQDVGALQFVFFAAFFLVRGVGYTLAHSKSDLMACLGLYGEGIDRGADMPLRRMARKSLGFVRDLGGAAQADE